MEKEKKDICRSCIDCGVLKCDEYEGEFPPFCVTTKVSEEEKAELRKLYMENENHIVMNEASLIELEGYCQLTRLEETIQLAKRLGVHKIGIATCVGLIRESRTLAKILRAHGFEVYGVACKAGMIEKNSVDIDPACSNLGSYICNPIFQARELARQNCELNIVMGLCVGHDSLFYKYSEVLTTTLVVKDRITGHNPAAVLYNSESYYKKKVYPQEEQ